METCKQWNAPGGAVAVLKDNKVVYSKGFGYRDVANKLEWTTHTLFPIGSSTKSFTATAIAMMVKDGILEWDRPIRDYVPEFKLKDPIASSMTTIEDLLCHRTGLPAHFFVAMNDELTTDEILNRLPHLELSKSFRTTLQYCNLLYIAIAKIIEEISGMDYGTYITKRIFKPLQMKDSVLSYAEFKEYPDTALGYRERNGKLEEIEILGSLYDSSSAGGGIFSSIDDISKWLEFHLKKGVVKGKQLLAPEILWKTYHPLFILSSQAGFGDLIDENWWYQSGYGLGWQTVVYRGELMVFHGGSVPGYCAEVRFFPDRNVGVAVFGNKDYAMPFAITYDIIDRLLGFDPYDWNKVWKGYEDRIIEGMLQMEEMKKGTPEVGPKPTHPIEEYVGTFFDPGYGGLKVFIEKKALMIQNGTQVFPLIHKNYDTFDFEYEIFQFTTTLTFQNDVNGEIHGFTAHVEPDVNPIFFKLVPDERMRTKEFLSKFVGKYSFMGDVVDIHLKGEDTLVLAIAKAPQQELVPIRGMRFGVKGAGTTTITFVEDDEGKTTEFQFREGGGFFSQFIAAKKIE